MATITTIETPTLGDRSYVVHDGRIAFVVDPQQDIDRVLAVAEASGVHITHVFETHITTTTSPAGTPRAPHRRRLPRQRGRRRLLRARPDPGR